MNHDSVANKVLTRNNELRYRPSKDGIVELKFRECVISDNANVTVDDFERLALSDCVIKASAIDDMRDVKELRLYRCTVSQNAIRELHNLERLVIVDCVLDAYALDIKRFPKRTKLKNSRLAGRDMITMTANVEAEDDFELTNCIFD